MLSISTACMPGHVTQIPQSALSREHPGGGVAVPSNMWLYEPPCSIPHPKRHSVGSAIFARLTNVFNMHIYTKTTENR